MLMVKHCCHSVLLVIFLLIRECIAKNKELNFTLKENSPNGTVLGNIRERAGLQEFSNSPIILETLGSSNEKDIFHLDSRTGLLTLVGQLDREKECPKGSERLINDSCILIRLISLSMLHWINVNIIVQDVNDCRPRFQTKTKTVAVSESAPLGHVIALDKAVDDDSSQFDVRYYKISGVEGVFNLVHTENSLSLILNQTLDYEKHEYYNATLTACDGGVPSLCGSQTLIISVHDVNDHSPIFTQKNYSIVIQETCLVGQKVATVTATDRDTGVFGRITYGFPPPQDMGRKYFRIDSDTGEVYLRRRLNGSPVFKLRVEARDGGEYAQFARAWLNIHVVDVNDHPPVITFRATEHTKILTRQSAESSKLLVTIDLKEKNPDTTILAFVIISDSDTGDNAEITCQIDRLFNPAGVFELRKANRMGDRFYYQLITQTVFDREKQRSAKVIVICTDNGKHPLKSMAEITLKIVDRNEYPPHFNQSKYKADVEENSAPGSFVLMVSTFDKDATSDIQYELDSVGDQYFKIDRYSGKIVTKVSLNCETRLNYTFQAIAINKGEDVTLRASVPVFVHVKDVNDHAPQIMPMPPFRIMENLPIDTPVGQIKANDADMGVNAEVRFSLKNVTSMSNRVQIAPFRLNSVGQLFTAKILDRETESKYELKVVAHDLGTPPQTATATVFVFVDDENDNEPHWSFPNSRDNSLNVSRNTLPGQIVVRIRALDVDGPGNNNVTYLLNTGLDMFSLDPASGELKLINKPRDDRVDLRFTAIDNGRKSKSSASRLTILFFESDSAMVDEVRRGEMNFALIMGLVAVCALISMSLLIAMIIVRRRSCWCDKCSRNWDGKRGMVREGDTSYCPGDAWPGGDADSSLISPGADHNHPKFNPSLNNLNPLTLNTQNVDTEVASADSGHGASEEEVMNGQTKAFCGDPMRQISCYYPGTTYWCPPLPEEDSATHPSTWQKLHVSPSALPPSAYSTTSRLSGTFHVGGLPATTTTTTVIHHLPAVTIAHHSPQGTLRTFPRPIIKSSQASSQSGDRNGTWTKGNTQHRVHYGLQQSQV